MSARHLRQIVAVIGMIVCLDAAAFAQDLRVAAAEIGLSCEALAACGLHGQAELVWPQLAAAEQQQEALAGLRQQHAVAAATMTQLAQELALNPQDEVLRTDYSAAVAQEQSLRQQIDQAREDLFETATDGLEPQQVQKLTVWKQSNGRQAPAAMRVTSRSDAQWQAIEKALIAERRAQRMDLELASEHRALLATVRTEQPVIQAGIDLQAYLSSVEQAFNTAASPG